MEGAQMRVSGLAGVSGADMLHQPHQARMDASPGDKFSLVLPFPDGSAFGRSNRIFLPPLEMVVDQVMVEFKVTGVDSGSAMEPTYTWIGDTTGNSGIQLLYKAQSIYTATEGELIAYQYANCPNSPNQLRELEMQNDVLAHGRRNRGVELSAPATNSNAYGCNYYYLKLGPIVDKELAHAGPLNAYAASAWSIDVPLREAAACVAGSGSSTLSLAGMRLILTGHREDSVNAMLVSEALAKDGIRIIFSQANHKRETITGGVNETSHTTTLSELEGEVTDVWVLQRESAAWTSTTESTKCNLNWCNGKKNGTGVVMGTSAGDTIKGEQIGNVTLVQSPGFNRTVDTLSLGTLENPTRVYGQAVPIYTVKNGLMSRSYDGAPYFSNHNPGNGELHVSSIGTDLYINDFVPLVRDSQILYMTMQEGGTTGQRYGVYSGSFRIKNNFRLGYAVPGGFGNHWSGSAAAYANVIFDTIVYIRRVLVITHSGIMMVNEM